MADGFAALMEWSNDEIDSVKKELMSDARGVILEVGAGSGFNLQWYKHEQVSKIIGGELPYHYLEPICSYS